MVFFGALILILFFDLYMLLSYGLEATISTALVDFSQAHSVIPLAIGLFLGHLFWQMKRSPTSEQIRNEITKVILVENNVKLIMKNGDIISLTKD